MTSGRSTSDETPNNLTDRELEVVLLIVQGLTNREIADRLGISRRTVHAHVTQALRKTGRRSRTQLAVLALRKGWAPLEADDA